MYQRLKLKRPDVSLSAMMVFLISYIVVYGSYMALSFRYVKTALEWNQKNVSGQSPVHARQLLEEIFDRWGLEMVLAGLGILLLIVPVLSFVIGRFFRRPTPAGATRNVWKRCFEIAPFVLVPLGGIAFQIVGVRNYFAISKNMAVPILASVPFAGFFIAKLMAAVPKGILQYFKWLMPVWFFWRFMPRSLDFARNFHDWGGQHHSDAVAFLADQLQDPSFREKYAFVQSHIYIQVIFVLVIASAVFFAFRFWKKRELRNPGPG
jgi:hypothetical protein